MKKVVIFNYGTLTREYRRFKNEREADSFYERRKKENENNLVCEPSERCFTYRTEFGNKLMVQKLY